jgi:uncharacterized membrane protein YphA (DoxX/SURF4 family)
MKTSLYGRIVFGASAVLFGVIALLWHDADTWQELYKILSLPLGSVIGTCLMIALIIGGMFLMIPRSARFASVLLSVVYILFALVCIPGIIAAPKNFGAYDGFFEQFSLVCGAIAVYALTDTDKARSIALGRLARIGMGLCTVAFTLAQVIYLHFTASLVPTWILPSQMFWAILTTVAFALAAIAILINVQARLALRLMTLMIALFGILVWIPALIAHPESHGNWSEFAINFLITGAAWMVADLKSF